MTFIRSIFLSFTVWVLTALLNAFLGGTWMSFFSNENDAWPGAYLLIFICTLLFSVPGIFVFWIVLIVNLDEDGLFRSLLKTGLIVSVLSSLLVYILSADMLNGQQFFLSVYIVVASIASIMIHHRVIKSVNANKNKNHV